MGLQAEMRAAAVDLFKDYAASAGVKLQVYPGRPMSIFPPTAFVNSINERVSYDGLRQRFPTAECIVVHAKLDSKDAANQKDAFMDGFLDWVTANIHAASANSVIAVTATDDLPNYVPDWVRPEDQISYYATTITLEGYGE